jgi:hypothetical protein
VPVLVSSRRRRDTLLFGGVLMLGKVLIAAGAASVLVAFGGPTGAKEKVKKTAKAPHIYSQVECTGMKKMHWDDATQTCQKNK